jgi:hypothetical protein
MKRSICASLLLLFIPSAFLFGQIVEQNQKLPEQLLGEWYTKEGGNFMFGLYERGVFYNNTFWHYYNISNKHNKTTLNLSNDNNQKAVLQLNQKNDQLKFLPTDGKPVVCLHDQTKCVIQHNLARIKSPHFKKDSVYFNYFLLTPNAEQISIKVHQLLTGLTTTYFKPVDHQGLLHLSIPVTNPVLLEINLPYRDQRGEVYLLPGSSITLLQTHGKNLHYAGQGAQLAQEIQLLRAKRNQFQPYPFDLLLGKAGSSKPSAAVYSTILTNLRREVQAHADSLFQEKKISPLARQINNYDIQYTFANALLHYKDYTSQIWSDNSGDQQQNDTIPEAYFDFLKSADNDSAIIAPAYFDFIESIRKPDSKAEYLSKVIPPTLLNESAISIDTLSSLLLPLHQLEPPLTTEQRSLLEDYTALKTATAKDTYETKHQAAIRTISKQYYTIYLFKTLCKYAAHTLIANYGWQPGITMDLVSYGNLALQFYNSGQIKIPNDYLTGDASIFHSKFIAGVLSTYINQPSNDHKITISSDNNSANSTNADSPTKKYNTKADWVSVNPSDFISCDTINKNGLTLIFANNYAGFPDEVKKNMITTFFTVYPQEMAAYNPSANKTVIIVIDKDCPELSATVDNVIRFQPKWFTQHPKDIDVVTHEAMHIVQHYQANNYQPRWLSEGIADYVRQLYGLSNKASGWSMPPVMSGMNYQYGYRIAARFLFWIAQYKDKDFVKEVDRSMRENKYTTSIWKQRTGKTLDELWQEYTTKPQINL